MLYSLIIKLAMLGVTMGAVLWIGWTVPQTHSEMERTLARAAQPEISIQSTSPLAASEAAFNPSRMPKRPTAGKLDLNRATEHDFEALPGIGPVLAERIVEYRRVRGAFRDIEQLRFVKGIGKKKLDRIRSFVRVTPSEIPPRVSRKAT